MIHLVTWLALKRHYQLALVSQRHTSLVSQMFRVALNLSKSSYSVIGQYWNGPWGFKLGYAANMESKKAGVKQDDEDSVISGQLMYVHNGFVPYIRLAQRDIKSGGAQTDTFVTRIGLEYGF